jgi:NAD(P)-dependent dehydrogenase (short-subunit alcohol dehydrogenase family)
MPTVLITGASTGIGRATALHLAGAGWTVLAGVRKVTDGEALTADGGELVVPVVLDVTDPAQIAAAVEQVDEHGGRLDALVNNAGIGYGGPLELIPIDDLRHQLEVNVLGPVAVTQALLPALRRARTLKGTPRGRTAGGRIVLVSSIGGRVAMGFTAPYAASKHAIEAIGDALRVELHSSHVQVALIEPGSVATPIWDKGRAQGERVTVPPELAEQYGHVEVAMRKVIDGTERRGVPPEQVAKTIERALTARRMKGRYVIGRDARAMLVAKRLLPDHVFDRVARRALGV